MTKSELRRAVRERIAALRAEQRAAKSALITQELLHCQALQCARTVALFASLADEPQTDEIIAALSRRCRVVLPRVAGEEMDFYPYREGELERGAFGIAEPSGLTPIEPEEIDVIVVPAVAYTRQGVRLGRGRGYYDRYLSRRGVRATTIGICFAEQIVESIPAEPHDRHIDSVISA